MSDSVLMRRDIAWLVRSAALPSGVCAPLLLSPHGDTPRRPPGLVSRDCAIEIYLSTQ